MNLKFENDRKHCALQISWKDFGAWLSRHGASLIRGRKIGGQFWKFGNLICSSHLWVPCLIRAVYPEHNQSSILTLSVPKWQVPTQKQNDPTDDASATRSDRGNRGTSYPCLDWIKTTRTISLQIPVTVSFLLLVLLLFISSTYSTCGLLCTVSVSGCISTI